MASFRNWSGSVECEPARIESPPNEAALAALVAGSSGPVRVAGAGHSGTPLCETQGLLLQLDALAGIEQADRAACVATVRAGTRLYDLGGPLLKRGLAMQNLGDIDKQALAGAVATGTHGTGRTLSNISSTVEAVRLVDAQGEIREYSSESDRDLQRALRVSLGALGVFTALRLRLMPAIRLRERIRRLPVEACLEGLDAQIEQHRHFEFFWLPHRDVAEVKTLVPTEEEPSDLADRPYERIDWSARILPSERDVKFFEMEYAVAAEVGPQCFREVRARMQERHAEVLWPVEYRTVAPDDAMLSNAQGRNTVTISVHQDGSQPYREFFESVEPIFWRYGGRPHWGKIHTLAAEVLRTLYPDWDRFLAIREQLDPRGRFLNAHLRKLFGI